MTPEDLAGAADLFSAGLDSDLAGAAGFDSEGLDSVDGEDFELSLEDELPFER